MDPKERTYETVTARRLALTDDEWKREGEIIRQADERDGTLEFIEALFDDAMKDEPEYEW
ncbi:MAG: hypothetical protein RIB53_11850 [Roseitalea porphyridii]|jgi:hypothetical protein|uniref:hypothetical protein n=1 Tax=Alphaproteobacteria TaxID=28211 RepID=UPI0032D91A7B